MPERLEVRRGQIELPNVSNVNPHAVVRRAEQVAHTMVANDERAVDVKVSGGTVKTGDENVMVWNFSFQVLPPGVNSWGIRA